MILRTAIVSTRIYNQKKEKISSSGDPCSIDSYKTETMSSSWILTLNALTGGKLDKYDAHLTILGPKVRQRIHIMPGCKKKELPVSPIWIARN